MAEIAVNVVLFSLQQIIAREADLLIGVEEKVRWIETEFRLMVAYLESIDAQHQLHGHANDWAEQTRSVIRKTEDLIETYAKKACQSKMGAIYKRPIYLIEKRGLSVKLDQIKDEVVHVRQGWRSIDLGNNMSASSQGSRFSTIMEELDSALSVGHSVSLQDAIQWVRDELSPLHHFLQEIDRHHSFLCLGDRQKIWIRELRDIFDYVGTSLANSSNAPVFLNSFCSRKRVRSFKLRLAVPKIQRKILQLYRVYHTYGLGEILVNNTSIFPRIRMATPIPYGWSSTSDLVERFLVHSLTFMVFNRTAGQRRMRISYSSWLTPSRRKELLPLDLELMKALLDDTSSMRDLDRRMVVWLSQVSTNLESLVKLSSDVSLGRNDVFDRHKEIAVGIHDIAATRMNYGIGRALGEAGWLDPIAATSLKDQSYELSSTYPHLVKLFLSILGAAVISKTNLTRRVKSIRKDLQLMEALSHDVNRMEKLDTRLKIWVEEMQCVAGEANRVVNLDSANPFTRARAIRKINKIHNHILTISKWKHTYDIGDVKPMGECAAGTPNHNLEQKSYTSNDIDDLRSEIKLMHALKVDTYEAGGISEAWMEEMQNIAEDATKLVSRFDQMENDRCLSFLNSSRSFSGNSLRRDLDQVKYKIRQLSEIRIAYGIELTPRLPPDTVRQIKEKLVQRDHEHPCSIVPILGMRQTDKEALKYLIKYDSAITRHFVSHAWVNVPEDIISAASVLEHVTMQINEQGKKPQLLEEEPIVNELIKQEIVPTLDRWLIVLDEIRTIEVWQYLKQALQQISTGDRIIFISSEHTYSLLGSTSNAIRDMPVILRHLLPPLSTDHVMSLPSYLRQCLYYFALFPADFEVPTRRLIVLWVAEGLIRLRKNESESVEHVAECYLQKLIDKGWFRSQKKSPMENPEHAESNLACEKIC